LKSYYRQREKTDSLVRNIDRYKRWYLGYISGTWAEQDVFTLAALQMMLGEFEKEARQLFGKSDRWKKFQERRSKLLNVDPKPWKPKLSKLGQEVDQIQKDIQAAQAVGLRNTYAYLSSECLDIYVATSMRESWEYEDTSKFISQVFSQAQVKHLRPVYFDPTLSYSRSRIDKGLIEGLMLKRARCTLYMVQETDTLGKDSELASTLAQGKPVIAYIPSKSSLQLQQPLRNNISLRFVTKRLLLLMAELDLSQDRREAVLRFLLEAIRFDPMFRLVGKEEQEFLKKHKTDWTKIKKILEQAENEYFEKRASTLMKRHPLALQVNLESGVANGVLVVRSPKDCAQLLANLLTNQCRFTIERSEGVYVLREYISHCPFRVVTDDPMLTNSFWGFYGKNSLTDVVSFLERCSL
jgi:hypothetical protein